MPKQTAESMAAAQKPAARKPAAKKAAPKGEGTAKKPAAKKTAARKPAAKKSAGGTRLVIVESPAKAKTIGKYLGRGYTVTASMGHIRDLPASTLGIDVENNYQPKYIIIKVKNALVK